MRCFKSSVEVSNDAYMLWRESFFDRFSYLHDVLNRFACLLALAWCPRTCCDILLYCDNCKSYLNDKVMHGRPKARHDYIINISLQIFLSIRENIQLTRPLGGPSHMSRQIICLKGVNRGFFQLGHTRVWYPTLYVWHQVNQLKVNSFDFQCWCLYMCTREPFSYSDCDIQLNLCIFIYQNIWIPKPNYCSVYIQWTCLVALHNILDVLLQVLFEG